MAANVTLDAFSDFTDGFVNLFKTLGWTKSIVISLFFFFCAIIVYLLRALIKSKDQEIYYLRADNDAYRTIYLAALDKTKGLSSPSTSRKQAAPIATPVPPTPKKPKP